MQDMAAVHHDLYDPHTLTQTTLRVERPHNMFTCAVCQKWMDSTGTGKGTLTFAPTYLSFVFTPTKNGSTHDEPGLTDP